MAKNKVKVSNMYNMVKEAKSKTAEGLKIGILGNKKLFPLIKDILGYDPLSCAVCLEDKKYFTDCDLAVITIDKADEAKYYSKILTSPKTPSIIAVNRAPDFKEESNIKKLKNILGAERIIFLKENNIENRLKNLVLNNLAEKKLLIGRLLPSFRSIISSKIISKTSVENAGIALAFFLPASDMTPMTLNQMKMVIELAAIYGQDLSVTRIKELLTTLASGYFLRGAARQLLTFLPGPGWTIKTSVAYFGTFSLGCIAKKYFEKEAVLIVDKA